MQIEHVFVAQTTRKMAPERGVRGGMVTLQTRKTAAPSAAFSVFAVVV